MTVDRANNQWFRCQPTPASSPRFKTLSQGHGIMESQCIRECSWSEAVTQRGSTTEALSMAMMVQSQTIMRRRLWLRAWGTNIGTINGSKRRPITAVQHRVHCAASHRKVFILPGNTLYLHTLRKRWYIGTKELVLHLIRLWLGWYKLEQPWLGCDLGWYKEIRQCN